MAQEQVLTEGAGLTTRAAVRKPGISDRIFGGDRALWIVIVILMVISIPVILSSTMALALRSADGDIFHFLTRQVAFLLLSFFVIWVVHRIDYQWYGRWSHILLYVSVALVLAAYFFGVNLNDANRWLEVPLIGLTFQPSDLLKVALIMVLARELSQRQATIRKTPLIPVVPLFHARFSEKRKKQNRRIWRETTVPLLWPVGLSCFVIFLSGFSTAVLTYVTCLVMLYIGRVRVGELWRFFRMTFVAVAVIVVVMYQFDIGRSGTWKSRIDTFIGLNDSPDDDLQITEARIAVAKGGVTGTGPGLSTQRAKLPHSYSDFAYAFIIEEYGLVGGIVILALYLWLFFRAIVIFDKCERLYPSLLVLGLGLLIVLQAFTNIMVSVGLLPVTGQTLPLISLGGSSMVFTSLALGMILGVSRQMQEKTLGTVREDGAKQAG